MKTLTSNTVTKAAIALATQPITILKVDYATGTKYYADRAYTFGANTCEGKIISLSSLSQLLRVDNLGDASSISATIDDSDGTIKAIFDSSLLERTVVTVYLHYVDLGSSDATIILKGRISGDITWDEAERNVSFNVDGKFNSNPLGYIVREGDVVGASKKSLGQMLPLGFGTVIKSAALPLFEPQVGRVVATIFNTATTLAVDGGDWNATETIDIEADCAPALTGLISVGSYPNTFVRCTATYALGVFTLVTKNIAIDTNISIVARGTDSDKDDFKVIYIQAGKNIRGKYCLISGAANFCSGQIGNKCFFTKAFATKLSSGTITETAGTVRTSWGVTYTDNGKYYDDIGWSQTVLADKWNTNAGFAIRQVIPYTYTWVYNGMASSTVLSVYAQRTIGGLSLLQKVPSSYYTKSGSFNVNGQICSVIQMEVPLSWRLGERWDDGIFVSFVSPVGSATTDQISWILTNWTSYTVDATSFAAAKTKLTFYPSHFVLRNSGDALDICQDIAYQARIGLNVSSGTAFLQYLSEVRTVNQQHSEDLVKLNSFTGGFTRSEDIVTRYVATWNPDNFHNVDQIYIKENNVSTFGMHETSKNFYIYVDLASVKTSVDFWMNRLSNSWRKVKYKTFLTSLGLEVLDRVGLIVSPYSTNNLTGTVDTSILDTTEYTYEVGMTLASKAGVVDAYGQPFIDNSYYQITEITVAPPDPGAGISEIDYVPAQDPQEKPKKFEGRIKVVAPAVVVRGVASTFTFELVDINDVRANFNSFCNVYINGTGDVASPTTVTLVNGYLSTNVTFTGGSGTNTVSLSCRTQDGTVYGSSDTFQIQAEPKISWSFTPQSVGRGRSFSVSMTGGNPSSVYTISLSQTDTDVLKNTSGTTITTITTDGSGNFTASDWVLDGGIILVTTTVLVATRNSVPIYSNQITLIEFDQNIGIVYKVPVGSLTTGLCVESPSWTPGSSSSTGSLGVVVKTDATNAFIVVRGLACLTGMADDTNYYCSSSGTLDTNSAGKFVLRGYLNDLCWVGGAGEVSKLTDIKDVTGPAANNKTLVYNTTTSKWEMTDYKFAALKDVSLVSPVDGHMVAYNGTSFVNTTIVGSIGASHVNVWSGSAWQAINLGLGDIDLTTVLSVKGLYIKNGVVKNAMLVNSGITINGTFVALGGSISVGGGGGAAHTPGTGLSGSVYDGSTAQTWSVAYGSTGTTACVGNDSRLSDARTPATHVLDSGSHSISGKTAGQMLLATSASTFGFVSMSGDVTINGSGVTAIGSGKVTNAMLVNSTISGIALGASLTNLTPGAGLSGTAYNGGTSQTWVVSGVTNAMLVNSGITINGTFVALGGTYTSAAVAAHTPGTGLTGSVFDGSAPQTWSVTYGTSASSACVGNDTRLSDSRTPLAHVFDNNSIHTISGKTAGQVLLATSATTFAFTTVSGDITIGATGVVAIGSGKVTNAMMVNSTISGVALGGSLAALQPGTGIGGVTYDGSVTRTYSVLYGSAAGTACQGNDSRLSDSRTPTAHVLDSASHTVSGKTAGQALLATGAATFGFVTVSGDVTITGAGVTAIGAAKVTNAMMVNNSVTVATGSGLSGGGTVALGATITINQVAFVGTNGVIPGTIGAVPQPLIADVGKYVRADGTWAKVNTSELGTSLSANAILAASGSSTVIGYLNAASNAFLTQGASGAPFFTAPDASTVEISGTTLRVKDAGITFAKFQNISKGSIIQRSAAGAGAASELNYVGATATYLSNTSGVITWATAALLPAVTATDAGNTIMVDTSGTWVATRDLLLGKTPLTATSTQGSLQVVVSSDGDEWKCSSGGLELFSCIKSTSVSTFKVVLTNQGTATARPRLLMFDLSVSTTIPMLDIDLSTTPTGGWNSTTKILKLREIDECDTSGTAKKRMYLCSDQY